MIPEKIREFFKRYWIFRSEILAEQEESTVAEASEQLGECSELKPIGISNQPAENENMEPIKQRALLADDRLRENESLRADLAAKSKSLNELAELADSRLLELESQKAVLAGAKKTTAKFMDDIIRFRDQLLIFRDGATGDILKFIEMQYKELGKILKTNGVEPLEGTEGFFNDAFHTVIQTEETAERELDMAVKETFRPGYRTAEGLLRRQEVIVYKFRSEK